MTTAPPATEAAPVFTGMETQFQSADSDLPDMESEDGEEEDEESSGIPELEEGNLDIQILDEPPVPLDDYEDLEAPAAAGATPSKAEEEVLGMEDFEVLA